MAVIKGNFVRRDRKAKARAKATIKYIQSRPGKKGEQHTRELFGSDGNLTREEVFKMIDKAGKGTLFYRIVLSPDPNTEDIFRDIDLRNLTTELMQRLGQRLNTNILFAGAVHEDHSPNRHIHILALLHTKLTRQDFQFLRQLASELILEQRHRRKLTPIQTLSAGQESKNRARQPQSQSALRQTDQGGAPASAVQVHTCPNCGTQVLQRLTENLYRCDLCSLVIRQTVMGMQTERTESSLSLDRSML